MKIPTLKNSFRFVSTAFTAAGCAALLCSCATSQTTLNSNSVFKFTVLRYKQAVAVNDWRVDSTQSGNPDGEGLNIATAITHGNVDQWLASWDASERPTLTADDRAKLVQQWSPLKNGRVSCLGRVIAGADMVVEVSVLDAQSKEEKLRFPLKHVDGIWYQTAMETENEYLHWESSPNKIVQTMNVEPLQQYLQGVKISSVAHNPLP